MRQVSHSMHRTGMLEPVVTGSGTEGDARLVLEGCQQLCELVLEIARHLVPQGLHAIAVTIERRVVLGVGLGEQLREGELVSHDAGLSVAARDPVAGAATVRGVR